MTIIISIEEASSSPLNCGFELDGWIEEINEPQLRLNALFVAASN
jgi:hypothetical protein